MLMFEAAPGVATAAADGAAVEGVVVVVVVVEPRFADLELLPFELPLVAVLIARLLGVVARFVRCLACLV